MPTQPESFPIAAPLWSVFCAVAGVALTKCADYLVTSLKKGDNANFQGRLMRRLDEVELTNKELQGQLNTLNRENIKILSQHAECERKSESLAVDLERAQKSIETLESRLKSFERRFTRSPKTRSRKTDVSK